MKSEQPRRATRILQFITALGIVATCAISTATAGGPLGNVGTFAKWDKIEITMAGPSSSGTGSPNPFVIDVNVTFTGPGGQTYVVPGFYDGNGNGGLDGNVWKVRFSADAVGGWSFAASSANSQLHGYSGSFNVVAPAANAPDFYRWGRLEAVGTAQNGIRYLKFRDGPYWMKAGCDDPENFLGNFSNYNTPQKRRDAIDFLSARGVNSQYMLTHNIDGDDRDVYPWLGSGSSEAKSNAGATTARFNVVKLQEWLELFEYMTEKGVVSYFILEDDSAWTGYDHPRYYREMVARFGHLPALLFNVGEEATENYTVAEALDWMQVLEQIDPYDHPRAVHNVNLPTNQYIDATQVDFTAIQTFGGDPTLHNQQTVDWINACKARNKRVLMVNYDEPRPLLDRKGWWSAYIGGGVWEVHVSQPYDRPLSTWEPAFTQVGGTRAFMETLPFWQMEPANSLVVSGTGFCLAKPGEAYALYLPSGGSVTVNLTAGKTYNYDWWNPSNGRSGSFQNAGTIGGGAQSFTAPGSGDWALRIIASGGSGGNSVPVAEAFSVDVVAGQSTPITLFYTDFDGPGPYTFTIVQAPAKGTLSGSGADRIYTANANGSGSDTFRWRVNDGVDDSNTATVTLDFIEGNEPPTAGNQSIQTLENTSVSIPLSYNDSDGPGPLTFSIVTPPSHGTVVQDNAGSNDHTYTPQTGFVGTDSFTWRLSDGLQLSNIATVSLNVTADTTPPTIVSVEAIGDPTRVRVEFSEALEAASAGNPANYVISNGISVQSAALQSDPSLVVLTTSAHDDGFSYTLTVSNVRDRATSPNSIAPGSAASYTFIAALTITNVTADSTRNYELAVDDLGNGDVAYTDRTFQYSSLPSYLVGAAYIKTPNDDKLTSGDSLLHFDVNQTVTVFVMHDNQYTIRPQWLQAFTDTGHDIGIAGSFSVFQKPFAAGTITLGGNVHPDNEGGFSMYTVAIVAGGSGGSGSEPPPAPIGIQVD